MTSPVKHRGGRQELEQGCVVPRRTTPAHMEGQTLEPDTSTRQTRGTVLVSCLDEDARRICAHCLAHAGYDVHEVEDADEVMGLARAARPDVIITSYPTFTSLGVPLTALVRHDTMLSQTPVLSLTSWAEEEYLAAAAADGVSLSLPMPVRLESLLGAVDQLARRATN